MYYNVIKFLPKLSPFNRDTCILGRSLTGEITHTHPVWMTLKLHFSTQAYQTHTHKHSNTNTHKSNNARTFGRI